MDRLESVPTTSLPVAFATLSTLVNGNRTLGGVDRNTGFTYGFDPQTGTPEPDRNMQEAEIFSGLLGPTGWIRPEVAGPTSPRCERRNLRLDSALVRGYAAAMTQPTHHRIDYIELGVTDMAATKAFYGAAFGWTFNDYGPGYTGINGEGREAGGFALQDKVTTGGPLIILYSNDLEASFEAVKNAGGTITKEIFTFPGGRRFQFLDPSKNELAVWTEDGGE